MNYWKTLPFKTMQQEWYRKLEEEGFRDAEKIVGEELELKQRSYAPYKGKDTLTRQMREIYYILLSQQIHEAVFRNEIDEMILTWHAEGKNMRVIYEELEKQGKRRCRNTILFTIKRYELAWGIRHYSPNQVNRQQRRKVS